MSNDNLIHYWDPKSKKWSYYDDEGEACIETDPRTTQSYKRRRSPLIRIDELADELTRINPRLETLIEYIKGIAEVDQIESDMLQGEINEATISKDRLYDICILKAAKFGLKYSKRFNADLEDTIQNALLGACQAINTYTDGPFVEHLMRSIREEVMAGLPVGEQVCCLPWRMKPSIYQILQQTEPELLEVSHSANCSRLLFDTIIKTYHCNAQIANNLVSLLMEPLDIDMLIETEDYSLADNGLGEEEIMNKIYRELEKDIIFQAIQKLKTETEKKVILSRFGFNGKPMSLNETGTKIGVTRERIRQIESKALKQLGLWSRSLYLIADIESRRPIISKVTTKEADNKVVEKTKRELMQIHTDCGSRTIVFEF